MKMLKCIFAILILLFLFYRIGLLIKVIFKRKKDDFFNIIVNGFIGTFAIFELIALPFNLFALDINLLYKLEIIAFIVILIISFIFCRKEIIDIKSIKEKFINNNIKNKVIFIVLIILIGMQMFLSSYLYNSNEDDSFYLSWSQEVKEGEQFVNSDPSLGQEASDFPNIYILNSWETFTGMFAKILNIEVTTLAHTVYPMLLILISYMTYYLLARCLNKKHARLILLILSWIFLFSSLSARFRGYTLLVRIWQGKTIITNIFIPYIMYNMLTNHFDRRKIILLVITNIASLAFNPIAMWLLPLLYGFFTSVIVLRKQIKDVLKMVIVILPNLILLPIYLKIAITGTSHTEAIQYIEYIECFKDFIRDGIVLVILYLLSCIYILKNGNKKIKVLSIIIPILVFLTVLNPLFYKIVQRYVTTPTTYWRLYWLIPIEITIAYVASQLIIRRKNEKVQLIILVGILILISCIGKNIYTSSGEYSKHINSQKIPSIIIEETKFILENSEGKVTVVAPQEPLHGATMRQLSSDIILLYSRGLYIDNMKDKEEKVNKYNQIYNEVSINEIEKAFNNKEIDFIILEKEKKNKLETLDNNLAKIAYEDSEYIIIYNVNSEKINIKEEV